MDNSSQNILPIINRAATLSERLSPNWIPDPSPESETLAGQRLQSWCQVVAQGDWALFDRRLALDGLDRQAVSLALGRGSFAPDYPPPPWAETLQAVLNRNNSAAGRCLDPQQPLPFQEILLPFVAVARQQLMARAGDACALLAETAQVSLERWLLKQLADLSAPALHLEFSLFMTARQSSLERLLTASPPPAGTKGAAPAKQYYHAFVAHMNGGQLYTFFHEYSALARLLATLTGHWVAAATEFLHRLESDLPEIEAVFQNPKPPPFPNDPKIQNPKSKIQNLQPGLSDPHHYGRSVMSVAFTSGLKLVYKPKSLELDRAWNELLAWGNAHGAPLPFKMLRLMTRPDYGWLEWVQPQPCPDQAAARRYYRRTGMLLCLLYLLGSTDCHLENIVACGEHPLLIDTETLLSPSPESRVGIPLDSVLRTGMLPGWIPTPLGTGYDTGGLSRQEKQAAPQLYWQEINTDRMAWGYGTNVDEQPFGGAMLAGIAPNPNDYLDEISTGFSRMYRLLLKHRAVLLADGSPLPSLAGQTIRFISRSTQIYDRLLRKVQHPAHLRAGVDRSIQLEALSRTFLTSTSQESFWPLRQYEQQAMEQLDIPYFTTPANSNSLTLQPCSGQALNGQHKITGCFSAPAYDNVLARLKVLDESDLALQLGLIGNALDNRQAVCCASRPTLQPSLLEHALAIGAELRRRAIHFPDGHVNWLAPRYISYLHQYEHTLLKDDLYDGWGGIALFLAALADVTGDAKWRNLALAAVQGMGLGPDHTEGLGAGLGAGSLVYTLVRVGQFLAEPKLLQQARSIAATITPARIVNDRNFGLLDGAGGVILGLLALYQVLPEKEGAPLLARATACGEYLLRQRVEGDSGHRAWAAGNGKVLTGFSHGAAGMAYALLRLYETDRDGRFLAAAEEAIAYEREVFSPTENNWPNLRGDYPVFETGWCNGAPGIGLARLGGLPAYDTPAVRREIEIAMQTTQHSGLDELDTLCCGNLGRIETLFETGTILGRSEWVQTACRQAVQVVTQAAERGYYQLYTDLPPAIYNPVFFRGMAGIGYTLLRLARQQPTAGEGTKPLPCVLRWE